jgi:hypothetical protein
MQRQPCDEAGQKVSSKGFHCPLPDSGLLRPEAAGRRKPRVLLGDSRLRQQTARSGSLFVSTGDNSLMRGTRSYFDDLLLTEGSRL